MALVELHVSVEDWPLAMLVGFAFNVAVGMVPIVTVAVAGALVPPVPVQVSVYAVLVVNAPVFKVPLADFVPLQPPEAVQDVAFVELQVSVEVPPLAMVVGFAVSVAVGTGLAVTVTVAAAGALVPPAPEHVKEYAVAAVRAPVVFVPLAAIVPLQPPEAVHDVALVELQVSVEVPPLAIGVGLAVSVAVGTGLAGVTATVTPVAALVPPEPVQVSE